MKKLIIKTKKMLQRRVQRQRLQIGRVVVQAFEDENSALRFQRGIPSATLTDEGANGFLPVNPNPTENMFEMKVLHVHVGVAVDTLEEPEEFEIQHSHRRLHVFVLSRLGFGGILRVKTILHFELHATQRVNKFGENFSRLNADLQILIVAD